MGRGVMISVTENCTLIPTVALMANSTKNKSFEYVDSSGAHGGAIN